MKEYHLDACLVENSIDLIYLTNLNMSAGKLLVHSNGALLLVDGRYFQVAKEKSGLPVVKDEFEQFKAFCQENKIKKLGFDAKLTSYDRYTNLKKEHPLLELRQANSLFKTLRAIKNDKEIIAMQKSAKLLWKGFKYACGQLKKGITEKEVAKRFEIFCLKEGADGMAFEPIIAFGKNSAMPHYRSQSVRLKDSDIVLIDIGVVLNGYNSDMTRVVFTKKNPQLDKLYQIVKKAQKNALSLCRPGTKLKELDAAARKVMAKEKVEDLFVHGLGHGIGLECHEFPRVASIGEDTDVELQPGMVITIEPGLYVPGIGGVRYEDTIVITENGYKNFYRIGP